MRISMYCSCCVVDIIVVWSGIFIVCMVLCLVVMLVVMYPVACMYQIFDKLQSRASND